VAAATAARQAPGAESRSYRGPKIDIVVPAYNESAALERSVRRLHGFLKTSMPFAWRIVIADNASTDQTWSIARRLRSQLDGVDALHVEHKGRGGALRLSTGWRIQTRAWTSWPRQPATCGASPGC
jgi:hypothetical protein